MPHTDFVAENTSQALPVWQFLQPHRSIVLCREGKLLVSVHLVTDAPAVAAKMERFQFFAKGQTEFSMWVCNHTDDFIAMILTEKGSEVPINYYNCVRPRHQRLIESDNRYENRRLMIKAQAENKTVAEVKAEAAATGKAADVTELVLAVTPTTQDFKGAEWSMAPLAIRGDPKPTRMALVRSAAVFDPVRIQDTSAPVPRGIGYSHRPPSDNEVSYGSSGIGSSGFGSIPLSAKRPVASEGAELSEKKPKADLPGEAAVAGKIGVSEEKVSVNGVEFHLDLKFDQTVSFALLLSLWDKLEVTLPTASDLENALKETSSVAGAITKVYESAEDLILGESKPDCVFFSCGHKITTMELAASVHTCPLCRALIYARIPASEIRNAVVQQI